MNQPTAVFIGASAGGVAAVQTLLKHLTNFSLPLIIVQHLPYHAQIDSHLVFASHTKLKVCEAQDKTEIQSGHVYFAPPSYHLLVEKDFSLSLSQDEPVQFARPSIDVLFETAATTYGPHACGIVLTGANADGARGLKYIHQKGGYTIVQDPNRAEVSTMPYAAIEMTKPDFIGDLPAIGKKLRAFQKVACQ